MLFVLFAITLLLIAIFNRKAFIIALAGFVAILIFAYITEIHFSIYEHIFGKAPFIIQLFNKNLREGEWHVLLNLFGLLLGFEILAKLFRESNVPALLPKYLPAGWKGSFVFLIFVFVLSAFLDNIAAALIGVAIAAEVFKGRVHTGYLVAIVAASNAGGAGSVIGDTTTTMMWLGGINPLDVLYAYIAGVAALLFFGIIASLQQDKYIKKDIEIYRFKDLENSTVRAGLNPAPTTNQRIDKGYLIIVIMVLAGAIVSNILIGLPFVGVWLALIIGATFRKIYWSETGKALNGSLFLICLVLATSLMPVKSLPSASVHSVFIIGIVSAVFNNIPLTKLCLQQGGYDWGLLAYAIGFGGSMLWFGSSAGVAVTNEFSEARNTGHWIKSGWHVILAYIVGFLALYRIMGWNPLK